MEMTSKEEGAAHAASIPLTGATVDVAEGIVKPKVHFNIWQTLGMNFSLTAAPIGVGAYLALIVGLGGPPFYIWGFLFAAVFQIVTCVAVAELASAIPHSSGPAFWVQHLAPEKWSKFLGYLIGWLTNAFWWFVSVANTLYLAQLTIAGAIATHPTYNPPEWHYYVVYIGWSLLLFVLNLPGFFKVLPHSLAAAIAIINITAIYLLVALLVRATPKPTARTVFVDIVNSSGWPNGVVFFLNLSPGVLAVGGFDSVTHITDEVAHPSRQVPQVMIGSAILSAIAGFIMTIVFSYCVVNPEGLLAPYGHQPLVQLIFDAARSDAIAIVGLLGIIISIYLASVGAFTSWNRLYWSLARERGLPFSKAMSKLSSRDSLPLNALMVNLFLLVGLGAIQVGSLTALNAILGGAYVCSLGSYAVALVLALWRGRDYLKADRWLNLGRFGILIQSVALVWCVFISVWLCFPLYLPVTVAYMNYASVVCVGVLVCSLVYWVAFNKTIKNSELEN